MGRPQQVPSPGRLGCNPRLAVQWLRSEALHVAGLVDPGPDTKWLGASPSNAVLVQPDPNSPDVAQTLRDWADNASLHDAVIATLAGRDPFHLYTNDGYTGFTLSGLPVPIAFAADWDPFADVSTAA